MAPIRASGAALLLTAPLLLGLAAAYPHRSYHDEADVQAPEKSVRHIDGLGVQQASETNRQLDDAVRQMQDQIKSTGATGSGRWSVSRYSEYSSGAGGDAGSVAPIRATITGEALEGGDGILGLSTNCHNCRMRIRKVGGASSSTAGEYAGEQAAGGGVVQVQSSQSRYHSSRSEGGQGSYGGARSDGALGYGGTGAGSSRVVQSSRVVESSGYGTAASRPEYADLDAAAAGISGVSGSSRKDTRVTKSSWQLSDLGYGTSNIEDIIRRLDEDMRAGRFQNGKTVTTVTTTTSENGSPPITKQETFVKDGVVDVSALPSVPDVGLGRPFTVGHSEVEDLLKGLREELRQGRTQAGKTVTTVVESSSVNGGPPVVKKNTYVRDGFDASALAALEEDATRLGLGAGQLDLGHSSGGGSSRRTVHSSWSSGGRAPSHVDHLGGGELLTKSHSTSRNVTSVTYSSDGSGGHDVRAVDALGGGHLIRESGSAGGAGGYGAGSSYSAGTSSTLKGTRRVDALGGGHLIRDTDDYGAGSHGTSSQYSSSSSRYGASSSHYGASTGGSELKGTRRVDALGGGHLIRETDSYGQPTQQTLSVSQMPGYRKDDAPVDAGVGAYGSNSKYYSTFQSGGYTGTGGAVDTGAVGQQIGISDCGASRTSSSSTYKKVVTISSSGSSGVNEERGVDHLGGGHLIRGVPGDVRDVQHSQTDVGGNAAFIAAEQSGGRIPEAAPSSYFSSSSSSYQRTDGSGLSGVNPAAPAGTVVVPVRGTSSSGSGYASRTEWSDVQETRDDEFPPLGPATPRTPSIKLGYGSGNGGYGGPAPAAGASSDAALGGARGGKLSVSLMDIGIMPSGSGSATQQQVSETSGTGYTAGSTGYHSSSGYSSSSYGSSGTSGTSYGALGGGYGSSVSGQAGGTRSYSRQYESSAPISSHSSSWSSRSTYSSGVPSTSYGAAVESVKGKRMTQVQSGPDCDNAYA